MAPIAQEGITNVKKEIAFENPDSKLTEDEIVISGISGVFPKSNNVQEFMNNLYNKVDMVTSSKEYWPFIHPEMPGYYGKVSGFEKFDAQFFRVPHGQANFMDAMSRKLLENAYGALFDAGVSPATLAGTNLGVFIGCSFTDLVSDNVMEDKGSNKYTLTGISKTMQSNRISYWIDGKGPSYGIDVASNSSMTALEHAFWAIKTGKCSSAIVGGCNNLLDPKLTLNMKKAGLLCMDGKTKCFDKNADGYVRSEAISILFLQRASEAKRIYAEIVYIKSKYFIQPDANFMAVRKPDDIEKLLHQFYSEANVSTNDVEYVEASGAGIAEADAYELEAITNIFTNRKSVKVGCVKSNMGHSEGASDVCAITKVCLAYHKGELSGNINYHVPHDNVAGVCNGRIQIVTDNTPFKRGYTALNSFSLFGLNGHALLRGHYTRKDIGRYYSDIPRLVLVSGRIDDNVSKIFDVLKSQPVDPELIAMLHDFYGNDISGHTSRGYIILDTDENNETVSLTESLDYYPGINRPIWFLYSGMGSQWPTMGAELMKIPTFAAAIERCHNILKPKGIDIVKILTDKDETMFDNILHSFVGIAAMQIGLTDLLKEMGIVPDNIIGHSTGEMGCAYADGCLTTEETILASYYRGLVSIETKFINGLMAAVGLGYKQVSLLCPPEIEVACHNSPQSSTISGPAEIVKKFVEDLKNKNIFAKAVQTANIAYHSKYISEAGPLLKSTLKKLITKPKLRSDKWVCSSALQENWDDEDVKYASAEYFTNNLLNSVLFEEAAKNIPINATIIEIAPHGIMQAIIKRSHQSCINIPLTDRAHPSAVKFLLQAAGKLYQTGLNPKINILYPKVQYPVSTETPMLSSLVGWAHSEDWFVPEFKRREVKRMPVRNIAINLNDNDWKYIKGYERNGAMTFPEAAFLVLVWETLAMYSNLNFKNMSVEFDMVRFEKELYIKKDELIRFTIGFRMGINSFEISHEDVQIASGFVHQIENESPEQIPEENNDFNKDVILTAKDIYTFLENKGYGYKDEFQSIVLSNSKYNKASIKWTNKWVTFIDALIQLNILTKNYNGFAVPKFIRKLTIDTELHKKINDCNSDDVSLNAVYDDIFNSTKCGGTEIIDITLIEKPMLHNISNMESLSFMLDNLPNKIHMHEKVASADPHTNKLIQVSYAGLSLYDYQNIVGRGSGNKTCSMDFSGYNCRGEKVMGLVSGGALARTVKADLSLLWPVPDHWSLQDAATVPLHYALAFYCLKIRGHLERNQTVLVVGGAGTLGQAVISLCLASNCTVFATVRNNEKKQFLLRIFPQLKEDHILSCSTSETFSFYTKIAQHTKNSLCNYVISCATGEIREQAMKCVGKLGYFMDVNFHDAEENMEFNMSFCWGGRAYKAISLSSIFKPEYFNQKKLIHQLISEGIAQGVVKPLSRVVYSSTEITNGFRALTSNMRKGKVLITMEDDDMIDRQNVEIATQQLPKHSYLVIGCDTVVAIELADWLIRQGVKKIVLHQESNSLNSCLQAKRKTWTKYGVISTISTKNLKIHEECDNILTECEKLGPVHSIFIVQNAKANNITDNTLSNENDLMHRAPVILNLDKLSRKKCHQLSNFVIISNSNDDTNLDITNSEIENICDTRNNNLLPALVIYCKINEKNNYPDKKRTDKILELFNVLKNKLKYKYNNSVTCDPKNCINANFKTDICKIIGTPNNNDLKENRTLQNLNISNICIEEIRQLINKLFQIDYSKQELLQFTFARLEDLLCDSIKDNNSKTDGLRVFFNFIDRDEINASEPIVKIPSKISSCNNKIKDELDSSETHLITIPDFGGHSHIFSCIGELLKIQAVSLQLSPDLDGNNIHEMAKALFKYIKRILKFEFKSKFYILGYSFGVNIALELAALLENEGYVGVVYCLDSSPNSVRVHLDAYFGKLTENQIQNDILTHIFHLMSESDSEILKEELSQQNNWSKKVQLTLKKLRPLVTFSYDYQRRIVEAIYRRIKLSREYDPQLRLASELVLIKGILNPQIDLLADDYDLSKYTTKPVKIFHIESDHISAPYNCQVPNIVNKMLEPKLLEAYKNINLCEVYTKKVNS